GTRTELLRNTPCCFCRCPHGRIRGGSDHCLNVQSQTPPHNVYTSLLHFEPAQEQTGIIQYICAHTPAQTSTPISDAGTQISSPFRKQLTELDLHQGTAKLRTLFLDR
ncbi:unnamed protein product, partial [Prunus brigantina]